LTLIPGTYNYLLSSYYLIAGKSTLLDVVSGRLESKNLTGILTTNGVPINKALYRKQTAYVMQTDALFPLLTVREAIRYAAYFFCKNKTSEEKDASVEDIIKVLRLERCADTRVGNDENRGISGGEKRRVSIAVNIVHRPSIIFLDEPTSGLVCIEAIVIILGRPFLKFNVIGLHYSTLYHGFAEGLSDCLQTNGNCHYSPAVCSFVSNHRPNNLPICWTCDVL